MSLEDTNLCQCSDFLSHQAAWTKHFQLNESESFESFMYAWLNTATYEDIKDKVSMGATFVLPGFLIDATYDRAKHRNFVEFRNSGKIFSISTRSIRSIISTEPNDKAISAWLRCIEIAGRSFGLSVEDEEREGRRVRMKLIFRGAGEVKDLTYEIVTLDNMEVVSKPDVLPNNVTRSLILAVIDPSKDAEFVLRTRYHDIARFYRRWPDVITTPSFTARIGDTKFNRVGRLTGRATLRIVADGKTLEATQQVSTQPAEELVHTMQDTLKTFDAANEIRVSAAMQLTKPGHGPHDILLVGQKKLDVKGDPYEIVGGDQWSEQFEGEPSQTYGRAHIEVWRERSRPVGVA